MGARRGSVAWRRLGARRGSVAWRWAAVGGRGPARSGRVRRPGTGRCGARGRAPGPRVDTRAGAHRRARGWACAGVGAIARRRAAVRRASRGRSRHRSAVHRRASARRWPSDRLRTWVSSARTHARSGSRGGARSRPCAGVLRGRAARRHTWGGTVSRRELPRSRRWQRVDVANRDRRAIPRPNRRGLRTAIVDDDLASARANAALMAKHDRLRVDARCHRWLDDDRVDLATIEVILANEDPVAVVVHVTTGWPHRRPANAAAASSPGDPRGCPLVAGLPSPSAELVAPEPATVVIRRPAPRLAAHPRPAVGRVLPVAEVIGAPASRAVGVRVPDATVARQVLPSAVRRESGEVGRRIILRRVGLGLHGRLVGRLRGLHGRLVGRLRGLGWLHGLRGLRGLVVAVVLALHVQRAAAARHEQQGDRGHQSRRDRAVLVGSAARVGVQLLRFFDQLLCLRSTHLCLPLSCERQPTSSLSYVTWARVCPTKPILARP